MEHDDNSDFDLTVEAFTDPDEDPVLRPSEKFTEALTESDQKVLNENPTSSELIFIYTMIKSVARGDWGEGEVQIDNLSQAGFDEDQILNLQAAVEARQTT